MSSHKLEKSAGFVFSVVDFCRQVAADLKVSIDQIEGAVRLLEDGNTIPFIARYRKEATRGLDERQLRAIEDMLVRAKELAARKNTILKTIAEQGQLTAALRTEIEQCTDSRVLEDLYLPYRPKKRTRARHGAGNVACNLSPTFCWDSNDFGGLVETCSNRSSILKKT